MVVRGAGRVGRVLFQRAWMILFVLLVANVAFYLYAVSGQLRGSDAGSVVVVPGGLPDGWSIDAIEWTIPAEAASDERTGDSARGPEYRPENSSPAR